ncbi:MAG: hypothetical protein OIF35_12925, partial [Cellvibrionaceae bacterium]|nr:hypothetical protein [Cellvibrionaceae bacterium]
AIKVGYGLSYVALMAFLLCAYAAGQWFERMLALFLLFYLGMALLDVSDYRGHIYLPTIRLYVLAALCMFVACKCFDLLLPRLSAAARSSLPLPHSSSLDGSYSGLLNFSASNKRVVYAHLLVVYLALAFVYIRYGNILVYQDLRFGLTTAVGYIIKSAIYIPLVYWASREPKDRRHFIIYVLAPLLPALFIGSRGTVLMVVLGLMLIQFMQSHHFAYRSDGSVIRFRPRVLAYGGGASLVFIYGIYYLRRWFSDSGYLSPSEALNEYFYSDSVWGYLVMPLHLAFRETLGLTNRIVSEGLSNSYASVPLFYADLITILPGRQMGAGEAMGLAFGTAAAGGLTPGIIGGLYIDFGVGFLLVLLAMVLVIKLFERYARGSDSWLVIYALSFVQFLHLFHRGFLKPEYLFAYIIVVFYLLLTPRYRLNAQVGGTLGCGGAQLERRSKLIVY